MTERKNKGKILFLSSVDLTLTTFLIPHIKALQHEGYIVHAAAMDTGKAIEILDCGIVFHNVNIGRKVSLFKLFLAYVQVKKLIKKYKYDIVHTHTPLASFIGRFAAKLNCEGKVVYTAHGYHFFKGNNPLKNMIFFFMEKIASYFTDYYFLINKEDYNNTILHGFAKKGNVRKINGVGVQCNRFSRENNEKNAKILKQGLSIADDDLIVGIVAAYSKQKGYIELFDAKKLLQQKGINFKLIILGYGDNIEYFKNYVSRLKLSDVIFAGYNKYIEPYYSLFDIFVLPSKREGLPVSILEAMSAGLPVIASNCRGCVDEIINQETGILVPVGDKNHLAQSIQYLLENQQIRKDMGEMGKSIAKLKYDLEVILPEYLYCYEKIIKGDKISGQYSK